MVTLMDHGALLDFTHLLTDLAEPPVETHSLTSWEIFPRKKGTIKTLASLQSCIIFDSPFTLLQRKLDLEGQMFVCHGQTQSKRVSCLIRQTHLEAKQT